VIVWGTVSIWLLNLIFFLYRTWIEPLPIIVYLNITLLFSLMTIYLFYRNFGVGQDKEKKWSKRKAGRNNFNKETDPIAIAIWQQKYFRNPDLDIRSLSKQLQIPYNELSGWINQNYQQNFNAFINAFRVKEVVIALETQEHQAYTIMGLAQKAGFKSASSFYAAFKKEKGTTPSEYLKRSA
ncbi:MAG: helix-turn-helix domain-containing protein, partial [Flavobacteriaceae bacterium]